MSAAWLDPSLHPVCREVSSRLPPPHHLHHHQLSSAFFSPHLGFLALTCGPSLALHFDVLSILRRTQVHTLIERTMLQIVTSGWMGGGRVMGGVEEKKRYVGHSVDKIMISPSHLPC